MVNTPLARLLWPFYGQCTKQGLGTINKEKTREIECSGRLEILVRQKGSRFIRTPFIPVFFKGSIRTSFVSPLLNLFQSTKI